MSDDFIDGLVSDLTPVKPLDNRLLYGLFSALVVATIAAVVVGLGLRSDISESVVMGPMIWKPSIFLGIGLSALCVIAALSRPTGKVQWPYTAPLLVSVFIVGWQGYSQWQSHQWALGVDELASSSALVCVGTILLGGIGVLGLIWLVWLRRTASSSRTLLGAVSGLGAGALMAHAYAFHCVYDTVLYIAVYYCGSLLLLTVIGALLGKKSLNW